MNSTYLIIKLLNNLNRKTLNKNNIIGVKFCKIDLKI